MNRRPLGIATTILSTVLAAQAASLPVTEDSYSYRSKITAATNKSPNLRVDSTHRAFFYFDLSVLPQAASIRYARIRFFLPLLTRKGNGLSIHRVAGEWDESLPSAEPTIDPQMIAVINPTEMARKRFISVDITSTVQAWVASPTTNEGIAVVALSGTTSELASVALSSKEGAGSGYPAELDIELADVPIPPGSIGSTELAPGSVGETGLAPNSVTTAKIASGAVTDEKIVSVSGAKVIGNVVSATSAASAGTLNGIGVSTNPAANMLLPLDSNAKFPLSVLPIGSDSLLNADLLDGFDSSHFAPAANSPIYVTKAGDAMTGSLTLPPNGLIVGTDQFVIVNGNIGIGAAVPTAKLNVEGTVAATQFTGSGAGLTSIPDSALSAKIARYDTNSLFTGAKTFQTLDGSTALSIRAASGQTSDLQQWRDSLGNTVAAVSPSGAIVGNLAGNATTATSATNFSGALSGDVTGTQANTSVAGIRGLPISTTPPIANQVLRFDGSAWSPGLLSLETDVAGLLPSNNLSGTYSQPIVMTNPNNSLTGNGTGLASLNASNLSSGTLPDARLSGTYGATVNLTNPGNAIVGTFTATSDVNIQGNITKNSAFGMLLSHPSWFDGTNRSGTGLGMSFFDSKEGYFRFGCAGDTSTPGTATVSSPQPILRINNPGTFISAWIKVVQTHSSHEAYAIIGSPSEGFGFKSTGATLKGVASIDGVETEVDLGVTVGPSRVVLAIRRANSVDFYVDGILRGSASNNLPVTGTTYTFHLRNSAPRSGGGVQQNWIEVGMLTIGIPMF
jgi:hypothetical protein